MNPDQIALLVSSRIWINTVCNNGNLGSKADERADNKSGVGGERLTLKAPRKKMHLKMLSATNNCLTLLMN